MGRWVLAALGVALSLSLSGCGNTGVENAGLLNQPLRSGNARIKIVRTGEFAASFRGARVKLDGKEIADIGSGGATVLDVSAGAHEVAVDVFDHPNVYRLKLDAKSGILYTLQVSTRDEAVAAGMFGAAGMLVEAMANENGGLFKVEVIDQKAIGK